MAERRADDAARELLFTTESEGHAHALAVESLLARNASMRTNDEVIEEALRTDPEFRAEWERTARGRTVAVALVRYRTEHNVSQRSLADRLEMPVSEIERLERGDVSPSAQTLKRVSERLGIERAADGDIVDPALGLPTPARRAGEPPAR